MTENPSSAPLVVYFSSVSENTHRFVEKTGLRALRVPLHHPEALVVDEPYVLVLPTYGGGKATGERSGYVPKQVITFLNHPGNRALIRGVVGAGNTNFGEEFCLAGDIVSRKCHVPYLYRFELMGTAHDVERVRDGLAEFGRSGAVTHPDQVDLVPAALVATGA